MMIGRLSKRIRNSSAIRIMRDRRGVTALEYALLTGLVAIAIAGAVTMFGNDAKTVFTTVANTL